MSKRKVEASGDIRRFLKAPATAQVTAQVPAWPHAAPAPAPSTSSATPAPDPLLDEWDDDAALMEVDALVDAARAVVPGSAVGSSVGSDGASSSYVAMPRPSSSGGDAAPRPKGPTGCGPRKADLNMPPSTLLALLTFVPTVSSPPAIGRRDGSGRGR